jgi:hypothetical protein
MVKEYKLTSKDTESIDKMDGLYQHIGERDTWRTPATCSAARSTWRTIICAMLHLIFKSKLRKIDIWMRYCVPQQHTLHTVTSCIWKLRKTPSHLENHNNTIMDSGLLLLGYTF